MNDGQSFPSHPETFSTLTFDEASEVSEVAMHATPRAAHPEALRLMYLYVTHYHVGEAIAFHHGMAQALIPWGQITRTGSSTLGFDLYVAGREIARAALGLADDRFNTMEIAA